MACERKAIEQRYTNFCHWRCLFSCHHISHHHHSSPLSGLQAVPLVSTCTALMSLAARNTIPTIQRNHRHQSTQQATVLLITPGNILPVTCDTANNHEDLFHLFSYCRRGTRLQCRCLSTITTNCQIIWQPSQRFFLAHDSLVIQWKEKGFQARKPAQVSRGLSRCQT